MIWRSRIDDKVLDNFTLGLNGGQKGGKLGGFEGGAMWGRRNRGLNEDQGLCGHRCWGCVGGTHLVHLDADVGDRCNRG